jgi:hypothetical protein
MNKKTRFFKNVILLQFIPILLFGILILSNFREQKTLKIRQLHPYEFNYGYAVPLFVFGVGLVLALFSLFSKQEDITQDKAEILKIKRKQNFWKFAFYSNVFFIVVISIFSAVISRENPIIIDQPVLFYYSIVLRALFVVLVSLVTASFFLAAGINWKTNKTLAVIILIFSFFIIGASIFGDLLFMGKFHEASESYKMAKEKKRVPRESKEKIEDFDEYDNSEKAVEENEEINEQEEKDKLLFSFNFLIEDFSGFEGKNDFFDIRNRVEYNLKRYIAEEEDEYYYIFQYLNKFRFTKKQALSPDEFYLGFKKYKTVLYGFVSPKTYRVANFDKIIDALLLTYEDIGDDRDKWRDIYSTMNNDDDIKFEKYYSILEDYYSPKIITKIEDIRFSNGSKFKKSDIVWLYSFWARRDEEGIRKEVAIILSEIKEHYETSNKQ